MLPAGACLPCRERQAGGGSPAPRQDAVGRRGPHPPQAPGAAHPPALAAQPGSPSGGTATTAGPRPWHGAEENGVDYIFGLAGNRALHRLAYDVADDLKVRRAEAGADRMRGFASFDYAAGSWRRKRRVVARLEATTRGFDARYIVTSLTGGPRHLYEDIYCARGQAENLIKLHKGQLASDRTSCQSPIANQFRLVLHTAAYWLMLALRDAVPRRMPLAWAEFATLRKSLLKIGARVVERAARIRIHFASAFPDAALFRLLAGRLAASGP